MASTYDETFTDTVVGRALRQIVWGRLEPLFQRSRQVLELGCGTGEDAVRLARNGVRVIATDPCSQMIRVAHDKARGCRLDGQIEFHCLDMEELGSGLGGRMFDGVLSNFGAINCARRLPSLIADVAGRLRPGAHLLWVIMGRHVPWEWTWYLMHGDWNKAWRRLRSGGTQWRGMTISYPTPAEVTAYLRPYFAIKRVAPLGFALPPSYAAGWLDRSPRLLAALTSVEKLAQRSRVLAALSDHYIVEATRLTCDGAR